ncbi:MAG TPA: hypothetical protein VEY10_12885, partial [Flavisolibacter sp.]|nr:hypothetical protein [Flavisolibacter sp.]
MKKNLLNVLIFVLVNFPGNAQWNGNPLVGTPVVTTSPTTSKTDNVAATDGAGGMFTAWIDNRNATVPAIYIQRILADGTLKFVSEVVVSNASGASSSNKQNLAIIADGAGGAICVWQDARNRTSTPALNNDDIYGQRIDANGNVLWTVNGVRLTVADNTVSNKIAPAIELVNNTEAIIVYRDNRVAADVDLYAQKILISNGAPQWAAEVAIHGSQPNTQQAQVVTKDGTGGLFVVWEDPRVSTTDRNIYAQRIDNTGALLWGAAGLLVCNAVFNQLTPQLTSDGAGGIAITWTDQRLGSGDGNIFAQRLSATGAEIWATNGVAVATPPLVQSNPYIISSGSDFIVAWNDQRVTGNRDIYAQKIAAADGSTLWATVNGVAITNATGNQPSSAGNNVLLPDGSNGAVIIWDDARNTSSNQDIYAQRINTSGVVQWTPDGVPVSTATNNQSSPVAINSIGERVIVAWRDSRSGPTTTTYGEIFAARLQSNGVLPIRSLSINALVKNASIDVKWTTVDESNTDFFIIEKSGDGTRYSSIGSVKAKGTGNGAYLLNDVTPVKGANYYRIKTTDKNGASYYSSIALVQ